MAKKITYNEAFAELQQIVNEIENEETSIDLLSLKIKRAAELLRICKNKLHNTEEDVVTILKEIQKKSNSV